MKEYLGYHKAVYARDKAICVHCRADCEKIMRVYWGILNFEAQAFFANTIRLGEDKRYWQVDHIIERADGGTDEIDNLQTLCVPCHQVKTAQCRQKRLAHFAQIQAERAQRTRAVQPSSPPDVYDYSYDCAAYDRTVGRVDAIKDWVNNYLQSLWDANGTGQPKTLQPIESDYLADPMIYH